MWWAYVNIFPLAGWIAVLAMTMALAFCFSLSSDGSIGQGITLMGRLFLQLSYEVPTRGGNSIGYDISSKAILGRTYAHVTNNQEGQT